MCAKVLVVEDDGPRRRHYVDALGNGTDLEVFGAQSISEALGHFEDHPDTEVAVLDVNLNATPAELRRIENGQRHRDGHALAIYLGKKYPSVKLLGLSGVEQRGSPEERFFKKCGDPSQAIGVYDKNTQWALLRHHVLHLTGLPSCVRVFIVYGHDHLVRDEAVSFCRTRLGWDATLLEPVNGSTWMEQFEEQANEAALAWILATDDEWGCPRNSTAPAERRPRPNVILEYGYFLGRFGRLSNRVFLFSRPDVHLGSDVHGVAHIRLTGSFSDLESQIRQHMRAWLL